jgi:hypothetical protein
MFVVFTKDGLAVFWYQFKDAVQLTAVVSCASSLN